MAPLLLRDKKYGIHPSSRDEFHIFYPCMKDTLFFKSKIPCNYRGGQPG